GLFGRHGGRCGDHPGTPDHGDSNQLPSSPVENVAGSGLGVFRAENQFRTHTTRRQFPRLANETGAQGDYEPVNWTGKQKGASPRDGEAPYQGGLGKSNL